LQVLVNEDGDEWEDREWPRDFGAANWPTPKMRDVGLFFLAERACCCSSGRLDILYFLRGADWIATEDAVLSLALAPLVARAVVGGVDQACNTRVRREAKNGVSKQLSEPNVARSSGILFVPLHRFADGLLRFKFLSYQRIKSVKLSLK
jgi:hypothetical protein